MKKIDPKEFIKERGVDNLCHSAEAYFQSITDPRSLMVKPFHDLDEGPYLLCKLGLMLNGLRLGKSMKVLDFGAGSGWLSRFLLELGCRMILLDPSATALQIAKNLLSQFLTVMPPLEEPSFSILTAK